MKEGGKYKKSREKYNRSQKREREIRLKERLGIRERD